MRWIVVALISMAVVSCNKPATPPPVATGAKLRVALILPGSEADKGWNQMAKEGLDRIASELGAETKFVSNVKSNEFAGRLNYFASEGYDVIICHGGEFEQAVTEAAAKNPKPKYIVGGCPVAIAGATSIEFLAHDASALVGVVSAKVSKSKTAAFIGAQQVPTLQACYDGMKDGIATVPDAGLKLLDPQWTGSWDSPTKAKEKTEGVIAAGADVVYQNVDAAATGVFEAVEKANSAGRPVYAFGCNSNQNGMAPKVILGSVVIDVPRAYLDHARMAKEGKLPGGLQKLGIKGGYVDLVLNEGHAAVTAEVRRQVEDARKKLVSP